MSPAHSEETISLSIPALRRIDAVCDQWEKDWLAGQPRRWEEYLSRVEPAEAPELVRQLVLLEREYRRQVGEHFDAREYLARFPEHAAAIQQAFAGDAEERQEPARAAARPNTPTRRPEWCDLGYSILGRLGRGGMATVYLACHTATDRLVALKVLRGDAVSDPDDFARFRHEAETLARLQHPHIVQILEIGEYDGKPFFSMEYCEGGSLADRLQQGPLPPEEAATLLELIARAVHAAHQLRIIHRDLKPSNVLLCERGGVERAEGGVERGRDSDGDSELPGSEGLAKISGLGSSLLSGDSEVPEGGAIRTHESDSARGKLGSGEHRGRPRTSPYEGVPAFDQHRSRVAQRVVDASDPSTASQFPYARTTRSAAGGNRRDQPDAEWAPLVVGASQMSGESLSSQVSPPSSPLPLIPPSCPLPLIPKLADFGLAKQLDGTVQTQSWAVLGTPQYMSPEQARGDSRSVTAAADVYGLGVILYECLTGRPPFLGQTPWETLLQVVSPEVAPSNRFPPGVPRDLQTICLTCLQKDPQRRYRDADAVADDLRRFLRGESIVARRAGYHERGWKWMQRHPGKAALVGAVLVSSLLAVGLGGWAVVEREKALLAQAHEQQQNLETALAVYELAMHHVEHDDMAGGLVLLGRSLQEAVQAKMADHEALVRKQLGAYSRDVRPLQHVFTHQDRVFAVAFSRDGQLALTGSQDRTAQVWNVLSGEPVGPPLKHQDTVYAVAFSPDGGTVVTGCGDGQARLWDVATGEPLGAPLQHDHRVLAVAFSPDGTQIVTGSHDTTVRLWDVASGQEVASLPHPNIVRAVAFSPDGQTILTGCDDAAARRWNVDTAITVGQPLRHADRVFAVTFSPDGKTILTGSSDRTARLWDAETGQPLGLVHHDDWVMSVAFSPDGKQFLTGSDDHTARTWDLETKRASAPLLRHGQEVRSAAFSPDGTLLLTACFDGAARLWSSTTRGPMVPPLKHRAAVRSLAFSPDGELLLTGSLDGDAQLWEVATGQPLGAPWQHPPKVEAVAFSPDGRTIATGGGDAKVRLWDVRTGQALRQLEHEAPIQAVAFSPTGGAILTGSYDNTARLWDVDRGELLLPPLAHPDGVMTVAFNPRGDLLLTGCRDNLARLWQANTGELLRTYVGQQGVIWCVAFSPDGKVVLTGNGAQTAQQWNTETGEPVGEALRHWRGVFGTAFSPDGKTILTGSADNTGQLWDTATGARLGLPLPHAASVATVAFSPNGRVIATGGYDHEARLWEVPVPIRGDAERISRLIPVVTGWELDEHGNLRPLDPATWRQRRDQLSSPGEPLP